MNIKAKCWINDNHKDVNKIKYEDELILVLTNDRWNIEEVIKEPDRIVVTIERKRYIKTDSYDEYLKEELIEKLLRYGFSSVDMTVEEFVNEFFKKHFNERG